MQRLQFSLWLEDSEGPDWGLLSHLSRARERAEDKHGSGTSEYYVELGLFGPKSQGQTRKFGGFLLPHNLQTLNRKLLGNPEYYDRCVVYDMTNDERPEVLNHMKDVFIKAQAEHGELVIPYRWYWWDELHSPHWKGSIVVNADKYHEFGSEIEFTKGAYLILYKADGQKLKEIPIAQHYGQELFNFYEPRIAKQ